MTAKFEVVNCVRRPDVKWEARGALPSRAVANLNTNPCDVEAVATDPGQDGIRPTINTGHWVADVHRALADKRPGA
jgi:hypothetical protein